MSTWNPRGDGVLRLPSGRLVRGRGMRSPAVPAPDFGLYLLFKKPEVPWENRWVRWPDFWLPSDPEHAARSLGEAWERSEHERVEIVCGGGRGRTGTALACLAVIDGVPPDRAVAFVRDRYHRHAVEMPWQKRFVAGFEPLHLR